MLRTNARSMGPAITRAIFGQPLPAFRKRRAPLASPHQRIECEAIYPLGMSLRKEPGAKRTRRRPVEEKLPASVLLQDVFRGGGKIVRPARDVRVDRPPLV